MKKAWPLLCTSQCESPPPSLHKSYSFQQSSMLDVKNLDPPHSCDCQNHFLFPTVIGIFLPFITSQLH